MNIFATDLEKLDFLLEADAALYDWPDDLEAEAAEEKRPKYITNYIGSKQKLIDWIWKNTPDGVNSALDAFSGSAVVSYMYKTKGLKALANDRLRYCQHAAKAIVENNSTCLSDEEIDALLSDNPKAGTFVHDNFKGIFFAKGVHALIDSLRANCDKLSGYKRDIALFALGKSCMTGKGGFGHFSSSTSYGQRQDNPEEFKKRIRDNIVRINALVFDNGKENKAYRVDVNELLPKVKADLVYFDPPYATEFSTTNYERSYHFVEGLMTYWDGLTLKSDTKVKYYETDHKTVTKSNANEFFETFLGNATHIPHWLISYRDHAYPNEQEMKKIIATLGRQSKMKSKDHEYHISSKHGDASHAKERLFICKKGQSAQADNNFEEHENNETKNITPPLVAAANFHTSIPVEIRLSAFAHSNLALSSSEASIETATADPQFNFILCRTGTNRNGDHFTLEELSGRHMTAVNKKIDLQHSQDFADIVGGIIASDYLEDGNGGRVECTGELYTKDSQYAQLAYKLMKRGIIAQVSMECDYEEGECSICGNRVKSKADYCVHLRKFKGQEVGGKPVYEILHGVTFTGLGLLDRKGADENARILQVASITEPSVTEPPATELEKQQAESNIKGDDKMDEKNKKNEEMSAEAAKKKPEDKDGGPERQSDLEKENRALKAQVAELQKRIQELEAEQKSAANKARARKLINRLEKQGVNFGADEDRESELKRLAELSDEAFSATEAAYERIAKSKKPESETPSETEKAGSRQTSKASDEPPLRSDAGVRPHDVDDRKSSLEDKLRNGLMAAYHNRVGDETNETININ